METVTLPSTFGYPLLYPALSCTGGNGIDKVQLKRSPGVKEVLGSHKNAADGIFGSILTAQRCSKRKFEGQTAKNRFGRPYVSGRPLLTCDRRRIIQLHTTGVRKINIARELGITHSCVSKVIRRYPLYTMYGNGSRFEETGEVEARNCKTASCACPGQAHDHDPTVCRHLIPVGQPAPFFSVEWILSDECQPKKRRRIDNGNASTTGKHKTQKTNIIHTITLR